ncbi:hypothetical protein LBBP_02226 [Leptospira borgpetersenii serovar Ballum]|uniref:Uncharacterized protein n=1 Tax=Leptospira borgpetersenii serovar Ballum TaxID=280505 RepID=A0A0S2IS50_LEPBO|nr:hypothetical protein LBBP_02226 [Leptospira borgpetersenii serovar Ballum]
MKVHFTFWSKKYKVQILKVFRIFIVRPKICGSDPWGPAL